MPFAISPDHTTDSFEGELTTEDKIEVFISRVNGWQLKPAIEMRDKQLRHRGFAQLLIVVSYFEMIGKYIAGYVGEGKSGPFFKEGFLYTFPDLPDDEKALLDAFYKSIRNGQYHVGMTRPNVILIDAIPGSFGFNRESGAIVICPDRFVEDLLIRFDHFAGELRNPTNQELRDNFVARFDSDNAHQG